MPKESLSQFGKGAAPSFFEFYLECKIEHNAKTRVAARRCTGCVQTRVTFCAGSQKCYGRRCLFQVLPHWVFDIRRLGRWKGDQQDVLCWALDLVGDQRNMKVSG